MKNDEIKEILRFLSRSSWYDEAEQLEDYIIKLEEENEKLKEELSKADSITQSCIFEGSRSAGKSYRECLNWLDDYKSRCEKAIEEIKRVLNIWETKPNEIATLDLEYLSKILQGNDN